MGGAAGINVLLSLVRVKFAAVLIGTFGVGLVANFMVIQNLLGTVVGLGLPTSAVRDIVAAKSKDDEEALARASAITIRMCLITGLSGLVLLSLLCKWLSIWTFGDASYTVHIALLGLVILWSNLTDGYQAIIRGMRRIDYLAQLNIVTAVIGTITVIVLYGLMGIDGIVPAILLSSLAGLCASWYFTRKLSLARVNVPWADCFREAGGMVRVGSALMTAGVLTLLGKYITNALLTNQIGLEAIGIYSAAFAISAILVDFVLTAMSADYYPRLISAASQKPLMRNLVSEQIEIGLLLVTPGLLGVLSFAPWVIQVFYTSEFLPAAGLLQWFIIGSMASILSRPMGQVLVALGNGKLFLLITLALQVIYVLLLLLALDLYGLPGSAMAWVSLRLFHVLVMIFFSSRLIGFSLSYETKKIVARCILPVLLLFVASFLFPAPVTAAIGFLLLLLSLRFILVTLQDKLGREHRIIKRLSKFLILRPFLAS